MYPRNAASPPRIAIGAVIQISDGAVQSTGVSVVVRAEGGSETAGGGTVTYGGSSNVVYYAPTQAETNYTAFVVTAYKTGCIPVSQTIITTASSTSGKVDVSHVGGTAQTAGDILGTWTPTKAGYLTGDAYVRLGAPAGDSVSADVAAVKSDTGGIKTKTDYLPSATAGAAGGVFIAGTNAATAITTGLTANITGNLSGSVGSVTGAVGSVTGNVGGNVTGSVGSVTAGVTVTTNNDKAGYALSAAGVDAIWDEPIAGHLTAGTTGLSEVLGSSALVDTTMTGTPGVSSFTFTGGSTANGFYDDQVVYILSGTGIGQVRPILSSTHSAGTTTITVDEDFVVTPANGDRFAILVSHVHPISQITNDFLTTQMTESYAADGVTPTLTQALMLIQQALTEFAISGTSVTIKKLDGTTTAAVGTLDNATNPTSQTRTG